MPCVLIPSEQHKTFNVRHIIYAQNYDNKQLSMHEIVGYLKGKVSTGESDRVEVNARLQMVGAQYGDTLIESSLFKNKDESGAGEWILSQSKQDNLY